LWQLWRAAWSTTVDIFAILLVASLSWSTMLVAILFDLNGGWMYVLSVRHHHGARDRRARSGSGNAKFRRTMTAGMHARDELSAVPQRPSRAIDCYWPAK